MLQDLDPCRACAFYDFRDHDLTLECAATQQRAGARAPRIIGGRKTQGARASSVAINNRGNQHDQHVVIRAADATTAQAEESRITDTGFGRVFAVLLKAGQNQRLAAAQFDFGRQVPGVVIDCLNAGAVAGEGSEGGFAAHAQSDH